MAQIVVVVQQCAGGSKEATEMAENESGGKLCGIQAGKEKGKRSSVRHLNP